MKKLFASLGIATLCLVAATGVATAQFDVNQNICDPNLTPGSQNSSFCKQNTQNKNSNPIYGANSILAKAVNIISILTGVAAVIVIIIGGLQYILSTGDPNRINSAKNTLVYAVVGLVVALVAQGIVRFVLSKL